MNLLILSHWNWFSSWPSMNINFRYKCKIWLTCYIRTYERVNNILFVTCFHVILCVLLLHLFVAYSSQVLLLFYFVRDKFAFMLSHKMHPFKSKSSLLLQNIHSLIFILHTRDLPSQCLGLNYVYYSMGQAIIRKSST